MYLKASERYKHFDYKLDVLKLILQENPQFIKSVLESLLGNKTNLTKGDFLDEELRDFIQKFSDIQNLEHLHFIENEILNAKLELEWMIKREFLREWG